MGLIDFNVIGWVLAYYALSLFLQLALPGHEVEGVVLGTGGRHHYKFNAFSSNILVFAGLAAGTYLQGASFPVWPFIWNNINKIVTANLLVSVVQAVYVYLASFSVPRSGQPNPTHRELAKGGHTGNMLYDFFIGRELNPRITLPYINQTIDIKCFNEMRPGLPGWIILDLAFIAKQYHTHGFISGTYACSFSSPTYTDVFPLSQTQSSSSQCSKPSTSPMPSTWNTPSQLKWT